MIPAWLVKLVITLAVLGFFGFELSSPLIAKAQADSAAHDAADGAAFDLRQGETVDQAKEDADKVAVSEHVHLDFFSVDTSRVVHVTVSKEARSYLLRRFGRTKSWYHVTVKATASPTPG